MILLNRKIELNFKMDVIELMKKEMLRRNYSLKTIKAYNYCLNKFLIFCNKDFKRISKQDIKDYLDKLTEKNKSGSTINVHLNALKFLMEEILNKKLTIKIKYSKTPKILPLFLTKQEVINLINSISNYKHKLMIKLLYSSGLRVNELVNLKVKDLEFDKNYGWVRQGKGNKDRLFVIADSIKEDLLKHVKNNKLNYDSFLFNGYNDHISVRTIQEIVKKATKKAKINKKVHPHTLRHSYATHLIENGYDLNSVQSLLGHNSPKTTMIYIHMASPKLINVKSPLDNLQLENNDEKLNYEFKNNNDRGPIS